MIINLNNTDYQQDIIPNKIKFWHIFIIIAIFLILLFISIFVICGINNECRKEVPTLKNLLKSLVISPFLITGLNAIFALHFLISVGIYFVTKQRALKWSTLLLFSALCTYVSVIITLFVFPFTDWKNDYADYLIICSLSLWMVITNICLLKHNTYILYRTQIINVWNIGSNVIYILSSIIYFVMQTFFPNELSGILVLEICSALSVFIFLISVFVHLRKVEIIIKNEYP
jgi:hypothetical protein